MLPNEFRVKHHAVMYALLARAVVARCGESGIDALREATCRYGYERGGRMAQRASADGRPLDMVGYLSYVEWRAQPGEKCGRVLKKTPTYESLCVKCPWTDAWREAGLLEFGRYYCMEVDVALLRGYNPQLVLNIYSTLSGGGDGCWFEWADLNMTPEEEKRLAATKAEVGDVYVRDFEFHTAHLYFSILKTLAKKLSPTDAEEIGKKALEDFEGLYGADSLCFLRYRERDFTKN